MEIMVVEMLLVPYRCTPTAPRCKFQTLLQTPTQLYVASAIGQQETTGFCDAKKGAMFSTTSFYPDKVNSSWRRSDIHKAVTSKFIQHSRFRPSQSLPHKVSPTITTVNATADNQNSSPKISAKGPSSIGKKSVLNRRTLIYSCLTNLTRHLPYRIITTARLVTAPDRDTVLGQDNAKQEDGADRSTRK
jgi:hypothetical protein